MFLCCFHHFHSALTVEARNIGTVVISCGAMRVFISELVFVLVEQEKGTKCKEIIIGVCLICVIFTLGI